jgi:DMSO reductase family type II enzyme chaperone
MTSSVQEHLFGRGLLYRQLAAGFAYPTAARWKAWQDGSAIEAMAKAVNALGEPELQAAIEQLEQSLPEPSGLSLEEEYTFLFQRQTAASPYEGSYLVQSFFVQPQMLADVGAFYSAFGFQVAGDLSDHLGAELEFMAVLCLKEAYAREQGWAEQAETCAQARRRFLAEHIGRWLPVFVMRVKDNARLPFFAALAELTEALVSHDCEAMDVVPERTGVFMPEPAQAAQVEQDDGICAA